jgi:SAM-dependent methyltransferase
MLKTYFKSLYKRTMREAYARAHYEVIAALHKGGKCLDCGAREGQMFDILKQRINQDNSAYSGIEWDRSAVKAANSRGLNVIEGDLNRLLPFADGDFECVFGLSVLEHLLNPCRYLNECHRVLKAEGTLVILTPNISTYFTAALLLVGKMPSSGPHPDSDRLLKTEELFKASSDALQPDTETDRPVHRHLIVFSFRVLRSYLNMMGFRNVRGYGFGVYPFPNFMQRPLERIDPYHCHQMVFVAKK